MLFTIGLPHSLSAVAIGLPNQCAVAIGLPNLCAVAIGLPLSHNAVYYWTST